MSFNHSYVEPSSLAALEASGHPAMSEGSSLRPELSIVAQYLRIIRRRKWLIIGALLSGIVLGALFNLISQREYTANSTVEIARDDARVVDVEGVRSEVTTADQEFYQTQYGLLRSRALAERVAKNMRLSRDQAFRDAFDLSGESSSEAGASVGSSRAQAAEELEVIRDILLKAVAIAPQRNSRLVDISVTTPDPALSARIADAWARGFIEANIARGFDDTRFARDYLEGELAQMRVRLEESERAAVGYASRNGIFTINTTNSSGERVASQSLTEQSLVAYNEELAKAVADRVAAEAAYSNRAQSGLALEPQSVGAMRQRRAELQAQYQNMLVQFEPGYAGARALAEQIAQLDRSIAAEERRLVGTTDKDLGARYRAAVSREQGVRDRLKAATDRLVKERQTGIQFAIYQREADNNRQLYDALLQRYKQIGVAAGVGRTNVSMIDRADVPKRPSSPKLPLNLLFGGLLGVLAGFAITIIREQIDVSINDPAEVERQIGLPLLGSIPDFGEDAEDGFLALLRDPKSLLSDAMLSLRTRVAFTTTHGFPRTLGVTSSKPAEGKSTTAVSIANALASSGRKVLLIDFDMRSPSVSEFLGLPNDRGISNALAGEDDLRGLIVRPSEITYDVMVAGPNPPNAAELLASDRLRLIFDRLLESYDHIICDSPPVIGLADALLLATSVEATLFVVRAHSTRVNEVRGALERLRGVPCHLIGVTLTHYRSSNSGYGYDYGYGYGAQRDDHVSK